MTTNSLSLSIYLKFFFLFSLSDTAAFLPLLSSLTTVSSPPPPIDCRIISSCNFCCAANPPFKESQIGSQSFHPPVPYACEGEEDRRERKRTPPIVANTSLRRCFRWRPLFSSSDVAFARSVSLLLFDEEDDEETTTTSTKGVLESIVVPAPK